MTMKPEQMAEIRKQFFNDHAEHWLDMWYKDAETGRYDRHAAQFVRLFSAIPLDPGYTVCDVGCGPGVLVPHILKRIGDTGVLYEIDVSEKMIEINRGLHPQENIHFIAADIADQPAPESSCDVVICFSCFPHFQDKPGALAAAARMLKPGGFLCIAHFDSAHGINHRHAKHPAVQHDMLPEEDHMRQIISVAGFKILSFVDESGFYMLTAYKK